MDPAELRKLTDDQLIETIERLDAGGHDRAGLGALLEELFRRIRAEAAPGEHASVEKAITRLKRIYGDDGDDDGGVREPRRPPPHFDGGTIHLAS